EQAKIEPLKQNDKMRMEADLRRRLENLEDLKAAQKLKKAQDLPEPADATADEDKDTKGKDDKDAKKAPRDGDPSQDFQLQRAIDLLRAAHVFNISTSDK